VWKIKYDELCKLFKGPNIVQSIKNRRKWLGYIRRMDESSLCKKLTSQLEGSGMKGRLKLMWLDDVLQDLKILKVSLVEEGTRQG
jgi:hypothetical protein